MRQTGFARQSEYVRVAAGLDASGVVPVMGSRRGGEAETMAVEVSVTAQ